MYHVDIRNTGEYVFNVKSKDYELVIDTKGKGITPPDALLASLGSCIGVYLRKYAEGTNFDLPEFSIRVEGELSKESPVSFRKIDITIDLKGTACDERRLKSIHEFVKNCPVHNTLKNDPEVEIKIE